MELLLIYINQEKYIEINAILLLKISKITKNLRNKSLKNIKV